jgi:hypothetical protein
MEPKSMRSKFLALSRLRGHLFDGRYALPSHNASRNAQVKDKGGWYSSWEEAEPQIVARGANFDPTMFPNEQTASLPLSRCMRFLPHHQDTGGFFVAVLEKERECNDLDNPSTEHRVARKAAIKVCDAAFVSSFPFTFQFLAWLLACCSDLPGE